MIKFRRTDGGRVASGRRGECGDCVVRSTAIALRHRDGGKAGEVYDATYKLYANANAKAGGKRTARDGIEKHVHDIVLQHLGFAKVPFKRGKRPTLTEAYEEHGDIIVTTRGHMTVIVNGKLCDIEDIRYYDLEDEEGDMHVYPRKAMSMWRIKP